MCAASLELKAMQMWICVAFSIGLC